MQTNTNAVKPMELELFQFTTPELADGVQALGKTYDTGAKVLTLTVEKRKDMGKRLGLTKKTDKGELDNRVLQALDAIKTASLAEMVKLGSTPDWTGGRFTMRQSKNGQKRATLSLVSVNRQTSIVSEEQIVKAMAAMSDDKMTELMDKALAAQKAAAPVLEVLGKNQ